MHNNIFYDILQSAINTKLLNIDFFPYMLLELGVKLVKGFHNLTAKLARKKPHNNKWYFHRKDIDDYRIKTP